MTFHSFRLSLLLGATACSLSAYGPTAIAQEGSSADGSPRAIETMIVTAQKRSELITDVPMSITAVMGDQLRDLGVTDVSQLEMVTPGFSFQKSNYGIPVYTLRGVGFFERSLGNTPAVTVYVDQVPLAYSAMTRGAFLDLERLEILKGPQGTLFGQNSTGGAINYIAAKPTSAFSSGFDVSIGRFATAEAEAFVSGTLYDNLTARIAVRTENRDDWQKSFTRDDGNGQREFYTGRLTLESTPSDSARIRFTANGWIDESDTQAAQYLGFRASRATGNPAALAALQGNPQGYPTNTDNPRLADWDRGFSLTANDDFYQVSLNGEFDLADSLQIASITSYSLYTDLSPVDTDGTNYPDQRVTRDGTIEMFTQELRLSGTIKDRGIWMIGGNYQKDDVKERLYLHIEATNNSVGPFPYEDFVFQNDQDVETLAAFGNLEVDLTDTLSAMGSVRYTTQDREFNGCMRDPGDGRFAAGFTFLSNVLLQSGAGPIAPGSCTTLVSATNPVPVGLIVDSLDEDNVSWRAGLKWQPSRSLITYANITKGYKNGSYPSLPGVFSAQFAPVSQESLLAYEAGVKVSDDEARLQFNAAGFYYDYTDKQILGTTLFPIFGPLPLLVNIPTSRIAGAEMDITWRPVDEFKLSAALIVTDSKIKTDPIDPRDPFGTPTTFVGEKFPATPDVQFVGDAEYWFQATSSYEGFIGAHLTYRSDTNSTLGDEPLHTVDEYALLDLRAGIETIDGKWRLTAWVRNATNKYYWNNAYRSIDTVVRYTGMPRMFGLTAHYRY